jgi:hypothetical protein
MDDMKAVDLGQIMSSIKSSGRPNTVLWQAPTASRSSRGAASSAASSTATRATRSCT